MPLEDSDPTKKEIWHNVSRGTVVVQKFDRRGEVKDELVPGGNKLSLTRDERLFNTEQAANDDLDNFRNGSLVPVKLIDPDDVAELASNPNLLGEEDLQKMLKAKGPTFATKVDEISNYTTLARLLQIAHDRDASIKQVEVIQARMSTVTSTGAAPVVERTQIPIHGSTRPVTP